MMNIRVLTLVACITGGAAASAQDNSSSGADVRWTGSDGNAQVSYAGDDVRVGIGIDDEGDIQGEYFNVFGEDDDSNWIGELWLGDERGGVKLNYHWLSGAQSLEDAALNQDSVKISKAFLAVDQNQWDDRKLTLGYGREGPMLFWGAYVMKGMTGDRLVSESVRTEIEQLTGVSGNQAFVQDQFTDTITRIFERPYDYGAGLRVGRWFDRSLVRLRGGLDWEDGRSNADQLTVSLGLEKFFANTGHSLSLTGEYLNKSGDFEVDDSDTRAVLMYRYAFGESYQPRRDGIERRVEVPVPAVPAVTEARLMKNRVTVAEMALFDLDRSAIRSDTGEVLTDLVARIRSMDIQGRIKLTGHTCDLASDQYNLGLSQRRAEQVAGFFQQAGLSPDQLNVAWRGEAEPRVPNTSEDNRKLNRRVEIEFVSLEQSSRDVVVREATEASTRVQWQREEIDDPAWLRRALRNPIQHKREVDVYRIARSETQVRLGPQVVVNTFPAAADDSASTLQGFAVVIDVLENDSDPDGDPLSVTAVTQPANGVAEINGDQSVTYTPNPDFFGSDSFGYTTDDGAGGQAMAQVSVTVIERPPLVLGDDQASTPRTQPVTIDVLANDSGQGVVLQSVGDPANGTAVISGGQVEYTPERSFVGTDTFIYTAEDEFGITSTATISVEVTPFNQLPVAVDDQATTRKEVAVLIDVLANDFDPDGDPLTIISVTAMTRYGSAEVTADNQILYTPMPAWWGGDELTYTVDDGFGGQASATITLEVTSQDWGR